MASVFKRKSGSKFYTVSYVDHAGRRRERSSRTTDFKAAQRIGAKWEADAALRREGVVSTEHAKHAAADSKPLAGHIEEYLRHCRESEQAKVTVSEKGRHLAWMLEATGWQRLSDLAPEPLQGALALLRERGLSARTCNYKRECAVAFASWCVRMRRMPSNPLKLVESLDQDRDRRYQRRALTEDEFGRLLAVAEKAGRRAWYLLAALAGLRRSEIGRLAWGDLDLEAGTVTITRGKAKRTDVVPLHPDLADELRRIRPSLALPTARIFASMVTALTVKKDMARAGIPKVDDAGHVVDLHALRTTLGTRLARAGIAPQVAQRIMRHSDYRLTQRHYVRLSLEDDSAALAQLGRIEPSPTEALALTGTGPVLDAAASTHNHPHSQREMAPDDAGPCEIASWHDEPPVERKSAPQAGLCEPVLAGALAHPEGLEPPTVGSEDRRPAPQVAHSQEDTTGVSGVPAESPAVGCGKLPLEEDSDLATVRARWPSLPHSVREAILMLVRASSGSSGQSSGGTP